MATRKTTDKPTDDQAKNDADNKKASPATRAKKPAAAAKPKAKKSAKKVEEEEEEEKEKDLRPYITPPPKPVVVAPPPPPPPPAPVVAKPAAPPPPPATPAAPATPPAAAAPATPPAPAKPATPPPPARPAAPARPSPFQKPPMRPPFPPRPAFGQRPSSSSGPKRPAPPPKPMAPKPTEETAGTGRKKVVFNEMMTVKDLAAAMSANVPDVIKKLLGLGTPASINQRLDFDTAAMVADGFGYDLELKSLYVEEKEAPEDEKNLKPRPPVVTVMGHVDHGKTSLLDAIRKTSVVKGEAGGITQHIGAYRVQVPKGTITFLDTPGHEAFTAMRARGGTAADIVILVVAADDSVMPQTIEAIDHAKAAGCPIVVAINKMDLPTANAQRVRQELANHNLLSEDWGGKTVMVEVSARNGTGIDKLLEMVLLEAELLDLKANPDRPANGIVLEAHLDPRRGNLATVLIKKGTMKSGDVIVCGLTSGRVRAMLDENYDPIEIAGPSVPVRLMGLTSVPQVGDQLSVVASDREAREIAERRRQMMKDTSGRKSSHVSLEGLHARIAEGNIQELPIIMKTDVQGSLQAIQDSLGKMQAAAIQIRFVHSGVGNINSSDVLLAEASDAILFGFNVKVEGGAEAEAKRAGVDVRTYQIIYEMLADIRAAMEGLLKPEEREVVKARAQVKAVFPSRQGPVAGSMVLEGTITRGGRARVVRGGQVIHEGPIGGLRRFKDDVKEVEKGYECGISVEGVRDLKPGDQIELIVIEKHARRLEA